MTRYWAKAKRALATSALGVLAACAASGCASTTQANQMESMPGRQVSSARTVPATLEDAEMRNLPRAVEDLRAMQGPGGHRNEIQMPDAPMPSGNGVQLESIDEAPWENGGMLEAEIDPAVMQY